jgi:NitT/TauT family transport system ATP-binding protein
MPDLVRLRGVSKVFANGVQALADVSLKVGAGEFMSVLGPSGCGKSTLLRLVSGLAAPSGGTIEWPGGGRTASDHELGFVFQEPTLLPWATALANVVLPLKLHGRAKSESEGRAAEALRLVGLGGFEQAYPRELSGGMKMRVSIARALVTAPRLLLMDEPFAALDAITRVEMQGWLAHVLATEPRTVVLVTHDVEEAVMLGDRVIVMSARPGRVIAQIEISLSRPRKRTDPEIGQLRERALKALGVTA